MFQYAPTVNDTSGQILGQGMVNSANTKAQAQVQMVDDIGGSLVGLAGSIAGGYMKKKEMESSVKAGDQMINMFGDQLGITTDKLKAFGYDDMSLDDKYAMHQNLWGNLGAFSNLRMANQRLGVQQAAPFIDAGLQGARDRASGNQTFTGATDAPPSVAPVEPPLPQKTDPVTSGPQAGGTPRPGAQGMTREQWEAMRADTVRLGNPDPGPYPY